jgi:hypothetical protein
MSLVDTVVEVAPVLLGLSNQQELLCLFLIAHTFRSSVWLLLESPPLLAQAPTAPCDVTYVMNVKFQTVTNILMNMSSGHITWKHILRRNTLV